MSINARDGNWHWVYAHTEADGTHLLQVDTTVDNTSTGSVGWGGSNATHHIGANGRDGTLFDGELAHLMVWNGPLTKPERDELAQAPL